MTAQNTKKTELFRKYTTKTEIAKMFNYSSANSFLNSSSQRDVLEGCNALIEIVEAKIKAKIDSFKGI